MCYRGTNVMLGILQLLESYRIKLIDVYEADFIPLQFQIKLHFRVNCTILSFFIIFGPYINSHICRPMQNEAESTTYTSLTINVEYLFIVIFKQIFRVHTETAVTSKSSMVPWDTDLNLHSTMRKFNHVY